MNKTKNLADQTGKNQNNSQLTANNLNSQSVSNLFKSKKKFIFLLVGLILFLVATSAITLRKSQTKSLKPLTPPILVTPTPSSSIDPRCSLEPDPGICAGIFPSYYFDQQEQTCKEFIWGGCVGVRPFETLQECQQLCETNTTNWKTYRNEKEGFEIKYPEDLLTLSDENGSTKLSHSIPYKHQSPCTMVGNEPLIDSVTDISLTIEISQKGLGETVAARNPFIKDEGYIKGNNLTLEPGFIDRYEIDWLKGYKITSGAECGIYEYFFPIVNDSKTLIVTRSWELTTEYEGMSEVLNLPGLITNSENEKLFTQILSTFKFTDNRKVTEQKLPNGIVSECKTDSECVAILSNNNCNLYCVNNTPSNQQIIQSLKKTCDATLWDPPLSLECGCISNICQLYE